MTDKTQPLALMLADRLHHEQPTVLRIDAEHAGEELRRQHARIAELEAARFAYASEFEPNSDGYPDVGSIHANIRAMKAKLASIGAGEVQALSAAPAGWNLVPAEVTSEMWEAFKRPNGKAGDYPFDERYAALLAAAPTPPAEQQAAPKAAPVVGNSGFDHKTAADFLSGKTVSDEAVRKFVQASRWAHDEKASLSAMLLSVRGELASRNAEIALLKRALMEAEAAPAPNLAKALNQKTLQNDSLHTRS